MTIKKLYDLPKTEEVEICIRFEPPTPSSFSDRDIEFMIDRANFFEEKSKSKELVSDIYLLYAYYFRYACLSRYKRDHEEFQMYLKVDELVNTYVGDYVVKSISKRVDKEKYINDTESMITGYIFQSPPIFGKDEIEREILHNLFKTWYPNAFVSDFCKKFKDKMYSI